PCLLPRRRRGRRRDAIDGHAGRGGPGREHRERHRGDRRRRSRRARTPPRRRGAAAAAAARAAGLGRPALSGSHAAARAHGLPAQGHARGRGGRDVRVVSRVVAEPGAAVTARRPIPNAVPHLAGNEWRYVKECLDTNWVSSVGAFVERFEREVAEVVGVPHAVATVNGSAALHVALLAAGVERDDEVLLPTFTFVSTAHAVAYCGAHPVFMDAEERSWGVDADKIADFLAHECLIKDGRVVNRTTGRTVRALLPVHLYGHPCDLDPLLDLARRYPLVVVED